MKSKNKKLKKVKKAVSPAKNLLVKKKNPSKKIQQSKKAPKKRVKKAAIRKLKTKKKKVAVKPVKARVKKKRTKAIVVSKKEKKKVTHQKIDTAESFLAKSFFKAKIKVIGIGGGGGSIVSEIGRSLHKASFVIADTDVRAFKKRRGIKYFLFGQELTHGLGTGLNTDLGKRAAEMEKERIAKLFEGQDIVIFIASLGGGLGSSATQVFAEATKDFGGIAFGIFTLPFKFEGKNKHKIATKALAELRKSLNVSITIPNERIFKIIDANTAITDAFSIVNKNLIESLESLIDLIYSPGVINIDFADLKVILNGRGNLAFLNTAEASGQDRAQKITQDILNNPLYQNNNFSAKGPLTSGWKAEKVLFNIAGGGNLSMLEVDKISRVISEQNPNAKIIFGISKDPQLKNKIKTTLLMTGPGAPVKAPVVQKPVVVPEVKKQEAKKEKNPAFAKASAGKGKKVKVKKKKKVVTKTNPLPKPLEQVEKLPFEGELAPVFTNMPADMGARKLSIVEEPMSSKKAIRRTALDIKKAEELEENKRTEQEKEWEIPAFLRKVKFKP